MSDPSRKDFVDEAREAVKPESQKTLFEQGKEYVTDAADKLKGKMQHDQDKGVAQGVHDAVKSGKDDAKAQEPRSSQHNLKEDVNEYYGTAKKKLNEAAKYVSTHVHGRENK